ncbi:ComF family protein [Gluconacetobacter entanii]|uniref:ComF family protein n=1 Tax=Gluconacetobacter entanii TaxID=108528 RepID=UPI001C935F9D|nr:ComF family protein [Gluconacetobacter entanii]MBY4641177.1 ComF family protein [Gluconacetobacter entanii]MCW4581071.1 ComF family protein [Gluconacetobacter entanii]MCW4584260.1 ComF family protein [Gluconacetobacter entanii]MCW4587674.1 ComF family protein [Gluconacetobacter entanii]
MPGLSSIFPPRRLTEHLRRGARHALDLLLPPHCLSCGAEVAQAGHVCAECFTHLHLIAAPSCRRCGIPFTSEAAAGDSLTCHDCLHAPPPWEAGRAALVYDDWSRRLILGLKYGDRTENAALLARYMHLSGRDLLHPDAILVPVPLHRRRLFTRRYNQSALLAGELSRLGGIAHWPDTLMRIRHTRPLGHMVGAQRRAVLDGAITVRPHRRPDLRGRHVILVDDVMTTGSTLGACAVALRGHGVARVDILSAARVCPPAGTRSVTDTVSLPN